MIYKAFVNNVKVFVEKKGRGAIPRILAGYVPGRRVEIEVYHRTRQGVILDAKSGKYAQFFDRINNTRTRRRSSVVRWVSSIAKAHHFRDQYAAAGAARRKGWIVVC